MNKRMMKNAILAGAAMLALPVAGALLALPGSAGASGIVGQCADCHTMHNSEQGQSVAVLGLAGTDTVTPIQNLLRMDCIACHAQDDTKTVALTSGSIVPQVYHSDPTGDLAAGNFKYIEGGNNRKGHNVADLFGGGSEDNGLTFPPGDLRGAAHGSDFFTTGGAEGASPFDLFTCAGARGCHGTRANLLAGDTVYDVDGTTVLFGMADALNPTIVKRTGIAAISGAHHNSQDGAKDPAQATGGHDGFNVAASYRFIDGLKGTGNTAARWQNVDSTSHNEYFGSTNTLGTDTGTGCNRCHVPGTQDGVSSRMTFDSTLAIPNQTMSGFCTTCHGNFHSSGGGDIASNGASGAFLRHPSDYVIPNAGEYADYTVFNITAPVARPTLADAASAVVTPGTDMVMCLSCHQAHATPHDGMLRFDYQAIVAGNTADKNGCLACHTTKGVAVADRTTNPGNSGGGF